MKYKLIGIAGLAQSGKDTAADFIRSKLPIYQKASFADPIKEMLRVGLGINDDQLYGSHKEIIDERYGFTPRYLMQTLGTEWGREIIHQNIWVNAMLEHINRSDCEIIIPDIRFESEADMIRNQGGIIMHVIRFNGSSSAHISESGVNRKREDIIVNNIGDIDDYYLKLDKIVRKHFV